MEARASHHHPHVHQRLGAQPIEAPLQDIVADRHDVAETAASEQERRHADAGLRGLVRLVECQRGIARLAI
jgi:hypothetical protein